MPIIDVEVHKLHANDLPGPSIARLFLSESGQDKDGRITLGPNCMSYGELEALVDTLKRQLDAVLQKGRRAFPKSHG